MEERRTYEAPSVAVHVIAMHRVLCQSGPYQETGRNPWAAGGDIDFEEGI